MNWKRCKQCLSLLAMGALMLALLSGCGTTEKDSGEVGRASCRERV